VGSACSRANASAAVGAGEISVPPAASGSGIFKLIMVVYPSYYEMWKMSEVRASIQSSNVDFE
jgi:hypothetical protein